MCSTEVSVRPSNDRKRLMTVLLPSSYRQLILHFFSFYLRWYGDFHDKFNFLKIQYLRTLNTCQKHFEVILEFKESTQWCKFFYVAAAIATVVYHKSETRKPLKTCTTRLV